jgi:plasmid stabilization system protein ParE
VGYKIIFKKRFTNNLLNVLAYLEKEWGIKVADEFLDKINSALILLKSHPYTGAPSTRVNVRGLLITKHNRLFYRVQNNTIVIISLLTHGEKITRNEFLPLLNKFAESMNTMAFLCGL